MKREAAKINPIYIVYFNKDKKTFVKTWISLVMEMEQSMEVCFIWILYWPTDLYKVDWKYIFLLLSGCCQYTIIPARYAYVLKTDISDNAACLLERKKIFFIF